MRKVKFYQPKQDKKDYIYYISKAPTFDVDKLLSADFEYYNDYVVVFNTLDGDPIEMRPSDIKKYYNEIDEHTAREIISKKLDSDYFYAKDDGYMDPTYGGKWHYGNFHFVPGGGVFVAGDEYDRQAAITREVQYIFRNNIKIVEAINVPKWARDLTESFGEKMRKNGRNSLFNRIVEADSTVCVRAILESYLREEQRKVKRNLSESSLVESDNDLFVYETTFSLRRPVSDFQEASDYLSEDDMVQYLDASDVPDAEQRNAIVSIDWILEKRTGGKVVMKSKIRLTDEVLNQVSEFVRGQNSDGLGEGFEQQEFGASFNPGKHKFRLVSVPAGVSLAPVKKKASEMSAEEIAQIDVDAIKPDKKDIDRADGLRWSGKSFRGDNQPFASEARKMASLIKDPYKLVRRAKAVAAKWGTGKGIADSSYGSNSDTNVWRPFMFRLQEMGFTPEQINKISQG